MRFVETKTAVQQKCLMLHRARHLFFRQQNAVINPIRAHLAELGVGHMTMTSATGTSLLSRFDRPELESESSGKRFEVNDGGALFPGCDGPPHGAREAGAIFARTRPKLAVYSHTSSASPVTRYHRDR